MTELKCDFGRFAILARPAQSDFLGFESDLDEEFEDDLDSDFVLLESDFFDDESLEESDFDSLVFLAASAPFL